MSGQQGKVDGPFYMNNKPFNMDTINIKNRDFERLTSRYETRGYNPIERFVPRTYKQIPTAP